MRDDRSSEMTGSPREVPVDWEALEDAFENNAPHVHSYLHLESGEVLRVVDGVADPDMHSRIIGDNMYLRVESVSSREQYRWMERFIQMVEEPALKALLCNAIDGKGAFRRFKDVLMTHSAERERWFVFRSERLRVFMEAWLTAHALTAIPRQTWPEDGQPAVEEASEAPRTPRRSRSLDAVRWQLNEVLAGLSLRELDRVLVFAEFVRARRETDPDAAASTPPSNAKEGATSSSTETAPVSADPDKATLVH